jgi:hypothetical protein
VGHYSDLLLLFLSLLSSLTNFDLKMTRTLTSMVTKTKMETTANLMISTMVRIFSFVFVFSFQLQHSQNFDIETPIVLQMIVMSQLMN